MVEDTQATHPPSPAETLRRAAARLREEVSAGREPFYGAVSAWLDSCAASIDQRGWIPTTTYAHAFAVATAYLGGDA